MADRFWVGGTGNINDTARWAATSGGAGGQSVPTSVDNAYFDGNSSVGAAFTVTINATFNCRDFIVGNGIQATALSQTMTLAGSSAWNIYGSLFFPTTNFTRSFTAGATFLATTTGHTITLNGSILTSNGQCIFNGVGGGWTLGSSATLTIGGNACVFNAGTLTTANYNMTAGVFDRTTTAAAFVLNLGSSTVTGTWGQFAWTMTQFTNLTINPGTSTLITTASPAGSLHFGNGLSYYNVNISNGSTSIDGFANTTFNNLTIGSRPSTGPANISVTGNFTVAGTLSIQSANTDPRMSTFVYSDTIGVARTITAAAIDIGTGVMFRNITAAGAAAPFNVSAKSVGDAGGNSNITFPAPRTVYWNLAGSQNWSANAWATTSTGTPALANFPLPQDIAVITEVGAAGTITVNNYWQIGTLTFDDGISPRTSGVTLTASEVLSIYGDIKLSSGVTVTGASAASFFGQKVQNLTSAGRTFSNPITLDSPGGSLVLQDNVTIDPARTFTLVRGTLNLNNLILETGLIFSNNSNVRSIAFGATGKLRVSGNSASIVNFQVATNFTFTGTSNVELTYAGSTGIRSIEFGWVGGSASEANALNFRVTAGFDKVVIYRGANDNFIRNLIFDDAFSGTWGGLLAAGGEYGYPGILYGNLRLSPNMSFDLNQPIPFSSATSTQQLTSSGKTIPVGVTKNGVGTLQLQDSLVLAAGQTFTHTAGTVSLNGRSITTPVYNISNSNVRSLIFGSGELVLNGTGTVWNAGTSTSLTMSPGTGKISIVDTSATGKTFAGGGILTYPELVIAGDASTSTVTLTGSNRFAKLTNARTVAYTVVFPNAQTIVNTWGLNGSDGNLVTLSRTGGSGQFTITSGTGGILIAQFVSISNSIFSPGGNGYAVRSTNGGGNTGWVFGPPAFGKFLMFFTP